MLIRISVEKNLRQHIAGFDIVGELFGLGLWAEAALFSPEQVNIIDTAALGSDDIQLLLTGETPGNDSEAYIKWVAGFDYTFPFGLYLNMQYAHGLSYENNREALEDYFMLGLEWMLFEERLKIGPLGFALEVDDFSDPKKTWAFVFNPEVI